MKFSSFLSGENYRKWQSLVNASFVSTIASLQSNVSAWVYECRWLCLCVYLLVPKLMSSSTQSLSTLHAFGSQSHRTYPISMRLSLCIVLSIFYMNARCDWIILIFFFSCSSCSYSFHLFSIQFYFFFFALPQNLSSFFSLFYFLQFNFAFWQCFPLIRLCLLFVFFLVFHRMNRQ